MYVCSACFCFRLCLFFENGITHSYFEYIVPTRPIIHYMIWLEALTRYVSAKRWWQQKKERHKRDTRNERKKHQRNFPFLLNIQLLCEPWVSWPHRSIACFLHLQWCCWCFCFYLTTTTIPCWCVPFWPATV